MDFFCLCNGPCIKKVWYSLKNVCKVFFIFKNYELLEGYTIFPQDNGTLFQNVYSPFALFLK